MPTGNFIKGNPGGSDFSRDYDGLINKPSIPTTTYVYFPIWAEENADLNSNAHEWAFGNGNNTPSGTGVGLVFNCELIGFSLSHEANANTTAEVWKNTSGTGKQISTSNSRNAHSNFENTPISFSAGDVVNFKTITGSAASNSSVATAWFRRQVTLT